MECFIGSPKRFGSSIFVCLELRLTPDSSALDSSKTPWGGSNAVSLSDTGWKFPLRSSATLWTPLFNSWSAKFSHSAGAKFRFWKISNISSGHVWEFNLVFCLVFGVELTRVSCFNVPEFDVDCSWLWSTATAVWPVRLFCFFLRSFFLCFLISLLPGTLVRRFWICRQTGTSHVRFRSLYR